MTTSPLCERAVITAAALSSIGCLRNAHGGVAVLRVRIHHIRTARREREDDVPVLTSGVDRARSRFGKVDGDFAVGGDGAKRFGHRDRVAAEHLAVVSVDLDPPRRAAENNRAVVSARYELIEIGLRKHHAVLLLRGDRQPAGDARREHHSDLPGASPLRNADGSPLIVTRDSVRSVLTDNGFVPLPVSS